MKSAKLLLILMCLLIAASVSAAAYEPTNGAALGSTTVEIKTMFKEEVAGMRISEISTSPVNLLERENNFLMFACLSFYGLALYVARPGNTERWRADRDYQSRFG